MKTLVLIRHAKSSWKDLSLADFDRPLNKRGKHDAPIMAQHLKNEDLKLEKIFSSAAKRAKKTAKVFAKTLEVEVEFFDQLYEASVEELVDFINEKFQNFNEIAIVSHNPELTQLSNYLGDKEIENIPTSAYVVLECLEENLQEKNCKIIRFNYPKLINSKKEV